jgi:ribosomal protein S18 acetylase RimI-like enzyme
MIQIRSYMESDETEVARLWRDVFSAAPAWNNPESDIRRKLEVQRELFFVALDGDKLVGTVLAGYDGHRGWVYYLAVSPQGRRSGTGRALMTRVEEELAALGCHKLNLQVRADNPVVVAFYRKLGYLIEERISMGKLLPVDGECGE